MNRLLAVCCIPFLLVSPATAGENSQDGQFADVARRLSSAGCIELRFLSIIESDIFDSVDSTDGHAVLSNDGRYNISLANDRYLFTGDELYNYSAPNNQVVIEQVPPDAVISDQISFLTRLDRWYDYVATGQPGEYRLTRKPGLDGDIPDSLVAQIDPDSVVIRSMEFYDINQELNRIIFQAQSLTDHCSDSAFIPDFPDSVDVLKL